MSKFKIHSAIVSGNLSALKSLLAGGEPIDVRDERGATPLFVASFHGQLAIVEFLLQQGVNVNDGNQVGYNPLMTAGREKHVEVVEALLKAKADSEIKSQGMKAIHWSLLDTRPKRNNQRFENETKLIEILKLFKRYGADLNTKGERGNTPLMDAAWWGLFATVKMLLQEGVNSDEKDHEGKTAVGYAIMKLAKNLDAETNERCEKIIQILNKQQ